MELIRKKDSLHSMQLHKEGEAEYLSFPEIDALGICKHMMTTRRGGVSKGVLASMNLSFSRGDERENVEENYRRIAACMGAHPGDFVCSDQTHTTNIRIVTQEDAGKGVTRPKDYTDVDGMITNRTGVVLATFFADCVPLLFIDPTKHVLGLSHSGWRGTAGAMGLRTMEEMTRVFGCDPRDIHVGIGPSICMDCYEVSEDVAEVFYDLWKREQMTDTGIGTEEILYAKGGGKFQLNLWKANEAILRKAGIPEKQIYLTDVCTCCNPKELFSHRASKGKRGNLAMLAKLL